MPLQTPILGSSRDPFRDWFPTAKVSEGRWSLLLAARPASAPGSEPSRYLLRLLRAPARVGSFAHNRLRQEIAVTHAVRRPGLAPVVDAELQGKHPFTVTEQRTGNPASLWRRTNSRMPLATACWIARQTAEILRALHAAGIRHGELQPEHLLLEDAGRVTVTGLGGASPIGDFASGENFAIHPAYAAPEQFDGSARIQGESDIYALGAMLFEFIARRAPYATASAAEFEAMHRLAPIPDLRASAPETPFALAQLVRRMLAKEPLRRPSLDEIASRLCDFEVAQWREWAAVA